MEKSYQVFVRITGEQLPVFEWQLCDIDEMLRGAGSIAQIGLEESIRIMYKHIRSEVGQESSFYFFVGYPTPQIGDKVWEELAKQGLSRYSKEYQERLISKIEYIGAERPEEVIPCEPTGGWDIG